jgi:hypothetical protein
LRLFVLRAGFISAGTYIELFLSGKISKAKTEFLGAMNRRKSCERSKRY